MLNKENHLSISSEEEKLISHEGLIQKSIQNLIIFDNFEICIEKIVGKIFGLFRPVLANKHAGLKTSARLDR